MHRIGVVLIVVYCLVLLEGCSLTRGAFFAASDPATGVDVAIITVLPAEYHAVLQKLENVQFVIEPDGRPNVYVWATGEIRSRDGKPSRRLVVAMAGEAGEVSGALVMKTTIDRWKPRDVLLVGIAGGIDKSLELGDVVISAQIWGYEHGHLGSHYDTGGVLFFQATPALLNAARALGPDWRRHVEVSPPGQNVLSKVIEGKTASGNKVIENANSTYFADALRFNTNILSVDMEGAGAAAAVAKDHDSGGTTGFLMIRGISDLVESASKKNEPDRNPQRGQWKRYAADVAASFAVGLIESDWRD